MQKKFLIATIVLTAILGAVGYTLYQNLAPRLIAKAILEDKEPSIMPKKVASKLKKVKKPINKLSEEVINSIHKHNITFEQILQLIDNVEEKEVNNLLSQIQASNKIESHDQLFDMIKEALFADYEIEQLRDPFKQHFKLNLVQSYINLALEQRDNNLIDFDMAKVILKQILTEKENDFNKLLDAQK
ncbi:MAG: hypothetical protein KF687_13770 [Cyclobacteriaceae bacterium]|nr:hypothetical protein [Cyclobacteriaceae bacterium]